MGLEHYESLAGIGFGGCFIYNVLLFYINIKAYEARRGEASALCEGGLPKGKKYSAFIVSWNNRTIPQKTLKNLIKSRG